LRAGSDPDRRGHDEGASEGAIGGRRHKGTTSWCHRLVTTRTAADMHGIRQICTTLGLAAMAVLGATTDAAAQATAPTTTPAAGVSLTATRADLEAALQQSGISKAQAAAIRTRLRDGDLLPGDRVALMVEGEEALTDTFIVRPTRTLTLPSIPEEISVKGVLRSELDAHMTREIGKYIRDPRVEAIALIRVAVMGQVAQPGFYNLPPETIASDVVMLAGGPSGSADLRKTVIRRNGVEVASKDDVAAALDKGVSIDQMNLQGGDEVVVGKASAGILGIMPYIGAVTGVIWAVTRIAD
jgi:protein involved in polysaccharide export with SLBB domain